MQSFPPSDDKPPQWIEIRDRRGTLLFKYDMVNNVIELQRGALVYDLIKLDEIRANHGIIPPAVPSDNVTVVTVSTIDK